MTDKTKKFIAVCLGISGLCAVLVILINVLK
jgi:hypothetical protein